MGEISAIDIPDAVVQVVADALVYPATLTKELPQVRLVLDALAQAKWLHDPAKVDVGRDAIDYVGKIANRLGVDDPAAVRHGKYELERVGEAVLAELDARQR